MNRKISIIHPSRQRSKIAKLVYDEWMSKANHNKNIEYILSVDNDDTHLFLYRELFRGIAIVKRSDNQSAIEAINNAAAASTGDVLIVISDDFACPQNWDVDLLNHIGDRHTFTAKTYDGIQPWMMTMPIMDRAYYDMFGYIYHPDYKHMFCDMELSCVADLTGRAIQIPMTFQHKHYSRPNGIHKDTISERNDATWNQGEQLFLSRIKNNFDLPSEMITGVINPDNNCRKWLKQKGVL